MKIKIRKCMKCGEVIYRIKSGGAKDGDLWKGSSIALHMIICDRNEVW